jgi:hypothetical protein
LVKPATSLEVTKQELKPDGMAAFPIASP